MIDGEIVALNEAGLPQFDALRSRRQKCSVVLYGFDLLYLDGYDLTSCPLVKTESPAKKILPRENMGRIRFTEHVAGNGEELFQKVEALDLEGIVMKRKGSLCMYCLSYSTPRAALQLRAMMLCLGIQPELTVLLTTRPKPNAQAECPEYPSP